VPHWPSLALLVTTPLAKARWFWLKPSRFGLLVWRMIHSENRCTLFRIMRYRFNNNEKREFLQ
jgi:hypothetical protein